jgi:phenylalanyl-tRNA synthetase beta chain
MRVSMDWLKEYVEVPYNAGEMADRLTMAGIPVEEIDHLGEAYQGIKVGEVRAMTPHPNADNLLVCRIGLGDGEVTVITAAKNLQVGDKVPLAISGTVLPNGTKIETADFRGVISQGMMCSETELGLARESSGIMVLPNNTRIGQDVAKVLGLDDDVLVLELTANRADCYGMINVAYEASAITGLPVKLPDFTVTEAGERVEGLAEFRIQASDLCPRYAARVLTGIKMGVSPLWMRRRLLAAGVRPISNMVDLTNYVMIELNQPLHAFDLDRLAQRKVIIRRAFPQERIKTLDEVERVLQPDQLLIADPEQGHCIAGVMGGSISEVTMETKNIFLESAYFTPVNIRRTAGALAMRTEASVRFGKGGIDPSGTVNALNRTAHLVEALKIGTVAKGVLDQYEKPIKPRTIHARVGRINAILGTEIAGSEMNAYLEKLGMNVQETGQGRMDVTVPTRRPDIENEADLAEEVGRLYGYDKIPTTTPSSSKVGRRNPRQQWEQTIRHLLTGFGCTEIMTYSFHGESTFDRMGLAPEDPLRNSVHMMVPLSEEASLMRTTLLSGILQTLEYNAKRRQNDLAVFEMARIYIPRGEGELPYEPLHLAGGLMGRATEPGWNQSNRKFDFYDGKGLLEQLFAGLRLENVDFTQGEHPILHPGRTAQITVNGQRVGILGEIHPRVAKEFGFAEPVILWELDLEALPQAVNQVAVTYRPLPKFPGVSRDIALVVPKNVKAQAIEETIRQQAPVLLEDVALFDLYEGEKIPEGYRSLAFSLFFRSEERTLQEEEVSKLMEKIIAEINRVYHANIRS